MTTKVIPKTELRDRIRQELAGLGDDSILITERGRPLAVVVSTDRWNELQGHIEDLEDALATLEHRLEPAKTTLAEDVFAVLDLEESDAPDPTRQTG